eukprot:COSAG01_NODE_44335_length_420_cov_0.741433_2_plen_46_part_01
MALLQMPSCFAQYMGRGHQLAKRAAASLPPLDGRPHSGSWWPGPEK